MSWLLVPLQYLFAYWRAERLLAIAGRSAGQPARHSRYLSRAQGAVREVELLQMRFPAVTSWIDAKRRRSALEAKLSS